MANRTGPDGRACESMKRFRLGETYAELKAAALTHRDLFDDAAASFGESAESGSLDCNCTGLILPPLLFPAALRQAVERDA